MFRRNNKKKGNINQTQTIRFHPDTKFESSSGPPSRHQDFNYKRGWIVEYDDGDEAVYSKDELIEALQHYEKHEDEDFGIVIQVSEEIRSGTTRKVGQDGQISIQHRGPVPVANANVQFDNYVFRISNWEEMSILDVLEFWSVRHRIYQISEEERGFIACHCHHTLWYFVKTYIKKCSVIGALTKDTAFKMKPYILTDIIMNHDTLHQIMAFYAKKTRSVDDLLDKFPSLKEGVKWTATLQTILQYLNYLMMSQQEDSNAIPYKEEETSLVFMDTKQDMVTNICNISVNQPLREILILYAKWHHIPIDLLQFMHGSKMIKNDCRRSAHLSSDSMLTVFRCYEPPSPLNEGFHNAQVNVNCVLEDDENEEVIRLPLWIQ